MAHSEDMSRQGFFDHTNPDGLGPQDRVEHSGLYDFSCGENLYMVTGATRDDAEWVSSEAFTGWLNSPGHYKNMIEPRYDVGGVGVFVKSTLFVNIVPVRYEIYVTHLLCRDMAEYNRLDVQYEATYAFLGQLEKKYEELDAEYKAMEKQYVNNNATRAQLEGAYEKLEAARIQLKAQVAVVNQLVEKMNAAANN